ncbi:MAG TPA: TIR domain-containing protein [Candidatus Saccharimonadales bacterium]|nr:TIR domain-containing protein [Candidatus Saccharimonadales bacterium]
MSKTTLLTESNKKPKKYLSQTDVPGSSLKQALRIAQAINDNYGKDPTKPLRVAQAMNLQPGSGNFRMLCGASIAYGLTEGGYNAPFITITALGRRIVSPTREGDDYVAKREATLRPKILNEFLNKYNNERLPTEAIAYNVLEEMGVPKEKTKAVFELILESANEVNLLKEINGKKYVDLDSTSPKDAKSEKDEELNEPEDEDISLEMEDETTRELADKEDFSKPRPNAIFLGHGKNKKPLEQLIKILDEYRIPHKEALAEPNAGRPIPVKVADTMHECGAAILIFTADEKFQDTEGNEVWKPSENVVHELGASSILYDNRIIIFKEEGVSLASNFNSIGYITFEKDKLSEKGIELFRELVNFKIVSITVG